MSSNPINPPIVAGVDGSPSALNAARWAADEAAQRHHPLRLVFANNCFTFGSPGSMAPPQSYFDAVHTLGVTVLADAEAAIRLAHPDLDVAVHLQVGSPIPTLIEQSEGAQLLVVGSRGTGGFHGILAGSTAVALVAHGHCPVAVIRGATPDAVPPTDGAVVVGVDGSATGDAAIAAAFDEASWRGADLVALHSWLEYPLDRDPTPGWDAAWDAARETEREVVAERLAGWQEKYPDVAVRRVVTEGRPVDRLLESAAGAQLLVVGSRGRGGFSGMVLGSTSQALIYHATCPVLVVRPTAG